MRSTLVIASVGLACGAGCAPKASDNTLANPAATFCVAQGGTYTIGTSETGGTCALPDGTIVDAWEYFRANADRTP